MVVEEMILVVEMMIKVKVKVMVVVLKEEELIW